MTSETASEDPHKEAEKSDARKRRRHRQWGGALLGLAAGLLGLLAGRLGQLYLVFDVFAQFGAQFAAVAIGFLAGMVVPRFRAVAGMAAAAALVTAYSAWPHVVSGSPAPAIAALEPGEKALRVAHFNTHAVNRDNDSVAAEILRLDADVMTLIEFETERLPVIAMVRERFPHIYVCHDVPECNLAVLSKVPLQAVAGKGNWAGPRLIKAKLGGAFTGLTVYGVHTTRFPRLRVQQSQIQNLVLELEGETDELLVMGDFNATPFSRFSGQVENGAGLKRLTSLPTWPASFGFPMLAIDHIFAGDRFRVLVPEQIGNAAGSDHYPIAMTLGLRPR